MQSLIYLDVIGKQIVALEQIRKGLRILGVLDVIERNPVMFEPLFTYNESILDAEVVLSKLQFMGVNDDSHQTYSFVLRFLREASSKEFDSFVQFCTGCKVLPMQKIKVLFCKEPAIFASTWLLQITLPMGFQKYTEFNTAIKSVICDSGVAFTSV